MIVVDQLLTAEEAGEIHNIKKVWLIGNHVRFLARKIHEK
jgi:hypothetical protein